MFSTVGCTAGVFLDTIVILDIIFMLCQFIVNKVLFLCRVQHRREEIFMPTTIFTHFFHKCLLSKPFL